MLNASIRVRCISQKNLDTIVDLLREESNAVYVEQFHTYEEANPKARASLTTNGRRKIIARKRA